MRLPDPPLLLITDRRQARMSLEEIADAAFRAGARWLMLREKDLGDDARLGLLRAFVALAAPYGATVTVNGDVVAAKAAGAEGVHLPSARLIGGRLIGGGDVAAARADLGPDAVIGASAHDAVEIAAAAQAGADYVTLSPIFPSASKPGYGPALGLQRLRSLAADSPVPVIALGGVTRDNARACVAAGAAGVAVMGPVMRTSDPGAVVGDFLAALGQRPTRRA